jgi:hypothetical protein
MNANIDTTWNLWEHSINNNDWTKKSYNKLYKIENLYDYKILKDIFNQNILQNTMLFIMRNDIMPLWEDPQNRLGCCASFKVKSSDILTLWNNLFLKCICENIYKDNNFSNNINGISIAPKKEFNIIKIWFKENIKNISDLNTDNDYINEKNCRLKKHILEY